MRKLALATAAVMALAFSAPSFTAPALAQDVKVKVKSGDSGVRKKVVIKHRGDVTRKKVVIRHGDRGRHLGWRHRDAGAKVVIKKRSGEGGSRTVIKKKTVID